MTTQSPATPNCRSSIASRIAEYACSRVCATVTPLPAARPSALTTIGIGQVSRCALAPSKSVKVSDIAVGMAQSAMSDLAKALLLSMRAASLVGPKASSPASVKASTMPSASGASGPTTVRSMALSQAKSRRAGISSAPMGTFRATE